MDCTNARTPLVEVIKLARRWNKDIFPLECRIRQAQLRYFGHIVRSDRQEKPREVAYAYIAGMGKQRGTFSHFQADLEAALSLLNIDPKRWEHQAMESNKDQWRKILYDNMEFALANWSRNRQNDEIEELSGFDSQEADEESVANGVQYEEDRHIDIGMAMLSIHLVSGSPEPMQPSDTQEVGNLQECHYLEIADFLASSEEDTELQEDSTVTRPTDDMLLVRQRVQALKIRVPIEVMEVVKWQLLAYEDRERLLFQAMRY
jgi:hypothetical protein